ncbi:hypothetical protein [Pantoea agglomerans]|uniref:transcriptional antitermination N peptide n=1 Tax=Enterobacter agglomerans TaxID=549 RepID=UPI00301B9003
MTVITYGTSVKENAKSRRHARRRAVAMDRERIESIIDAAFGAEPEVVAIGVKHISRIEKACSSPSLRDRHEAEQPLLCNRKWHHVRPDATHVVNARQKIRGKSILLI